MVSEDLFLSPDQVRVAYVFRNDGPAEVKGEVIFPLPPISLGGLADSGFALSADSLHRDNVVDFTVKADGKKVAVHTERIAILEPPFDERRQPAANYDAPGEDVTALLKGYGIPLSLNVDEVAAVLARLPSAARETVKAKGLADFFDGEPPVPAWSIIVRYHWSQTFAAGREIRIEHSYNPAPPGGIFVWPAQEKDFDLYHHELIQTYCIDAGTRVEFQQPIGGPQEPQDMIVDFAPHPCQIDVIVAKRIVLSSLARKSGGHAIEMIIQDRCVHGCDCALGCAASCGLSAMGRMDAACGDTRAKRFNRQRATGSVTAR